MSICPLILCMFVHLSTRLFKWLFVYLFTCLSVHDNLFISIFSHLSICPSPQTFTCVTVCLSNNSPVHLSICPSVFCSFFQLSIFSLVMSVMCCISFTWINFSSFVRHTFRRMDTNEKERERESERESERVCERVNERGKRDRDWFVSFFLPEIFLIESVPQLVKTSVSKNIVALSQFKARPEVKKVPKFLLTRFKHHYNKRLFKSTLEMSCHMVNYGSLKTGFDRLIVMYQLWIQALMRAYS